MQFLFSSSVQEYEVCKGREPHSDLWRFEMNCPAGARALTNENDVVGIYSARGSKGNVRFALGLPPQTPPVPECNGARIRERQGRDPIPTYADMTLAK